MIIRGASLGNGTIFVELDQVVWVTGHVCETPGQATQLYDMD